MESFTFTYRDHKMAGKVGLVKGCNLLASSFVKAIGAFKVKYDNCEILAVAKTKVF